jgi:hypothetical protein
MYRNDASSTVAAIQGLRSIEHVTCQGQVSSEPLRRNQNQAWLCVKKGNEKKPSNMTVVAKVTGVEIAAIHARKAHENQRERERERQRQRQRERERELK